MLGQEFKVSLFKSVRGCQHDLVVVVVFSWVIPHFPHIYMKKVRICVYIVAKFEFNGLYVDRISNNWVVFRCSVSLFVNRLEKRSYTFEFLKLSQDGELWPEFLLKFFQIKRLDWLLIDNLFLLRSSRRKNFSFGWFIIFVFLFQIFFFIFLCFMKFINHFG